MSLRTQTFRWLCLLSISLPVLFWFGHVLTREGAPPVVQQVNGLRGYVRVSPDFVDQFLNMHFKQCALVSSSGQMLGAGSGADIDSAQCVIRMNNAPTLGYEKDVGSRTSVRVVSHTSAPHLVKNERYYFEEAADTAYVFWGPEKKMRTDGRGGVFNALLRIARKYPNIRLYAMTQERVEHCDQVFQNETGKNRLKSGTYLSTGFFTMVLAMEMCDSICVYGMINAHHCNGTDHSAVPYHYYERGRMDECRMYRIHERTRRGGHRFITEKAIYAKWASCHKMEFKHPSWNISKPAPP
ncbi:alpha-N-acetyl-neuraminyl-2,3-beta-galactosyl-1,3-N-acetyl-galactosaminide alpha-2,6-sialyltransferase isoform X1 [Dunckerocampus dactyliophorus]|uniref:alpha-N-acetyl-neuraminyl-2,3-beta-galactosyl-1, 3-N-acetyl-galactosaminide alpha-2,6-sialyltransferase isoform X1 n=1 Tax=Dunckerocampus dactyliophorus TaxID=161453 RepID=UPI002405BC11|nr:alpha-N-acetyl-neuraminyl-2,3-beta-galactosyl-1,3-N-acetyl-galactosaminide alpha-2,6-sialyltransferase isoform X1 [Dunckerocampus dactyliophorus]